MWWSKRAMTGRTPANILAIAAAAAALAGCAGPELTATGSLLPTEQYKPAVIQAPEQIALAIHPQGLSPNQRAALADFVGRWRDNGGGLMVVKAPLNGDDPGQARRTADAMTAYLQHLGVPADRVRLVGYEAGRLRAAPVLASFERYEAVAPDCSKGWGSLTATGANAPGSHFGCADAANFALMIANPRDIVIPTATDPADNSRRQVVLGKYRQGQTTATARDEQASGTVSQQ